MDQRLVLHGMDAMSDSFRPEEINRVPHTLRSRALTGMNCDAPAGVACALEMFDKETGREMGFIPGEVERHDSVALGEQGVQFLMRAVWSVGAAQDADQINPHAGGGSTVRRT